MRNTIRYSLIFIAATALLSSCSRKKDRFLNRNWHSLNTKYNVLYNGNLALENGLKSIESSYTDDYWNILPVERLSVSDPFEINTNKPSPDFDRAEEKAVKAVQTHGMNIRGKEKNPQIDEAYILLGKSRYYSGRFIPALEAFNYILFKYPGSSHINSAKIWRAKTNLRLDNDAIALENLNKLLAREDLSKDNRADASATLAQLYISRGATDSALVNLKLANELTNDHALRGRLYFIEGQLYNQKAEKDSANMAFQKIIDLNRKVPRIYRVNAFLEQIKNFDYREGNLETFREHLKSIENDRENRPFLDRIYHYIANHHLALENDSMAIDYFNKSLRTNTSDTFLKAKNYHSIADQYFDASRYSLSGTYYDSTLVHYQKNSKPYRAVKKRLDNLQDVIFYESIATNNDSILRLTAMDDQEAESYFKDLIDRMKAAKAQKKQAQSKPSSGYQSTYDKQTKATGFYFYQSSTVAYGKNEFRNIWGDRPLEDNWRWSNKIIIDNASKTIVQNTIENQENEQLTTAYYRNQIPSDPKIIDSITKQRNYAYYQLGLIYKNKFKDYPRSREKLEFLLKQNLEERLLLPVQYNLFKVYNLLPNEVLANQIKQRVISEHPNSRYAQILQNPTSILDADSQGPEARYEMLFKLFSEHQFEQVIDGCDIEISNFEGDDIVPKFELLKTSAMGRLYGFNSYQKGLNYISLNYPNSLEGKQAADILLDLNQRLSNPSFDQQNTSQSYKIVYEFDKTEKDQMTNFVTAISKVINSEEVLRLKVSQDVYDLNTTFVVVHGLKSINGAKGFAQLLKIDSPEILSKPSFAISTQNYTILQIHKNLEQYLEWIKN